MKKLFKQFPSLFKKEFRIHPKHINAGDTIKVEWSRILGGFGEVTCVNNDPKTGKILIKVTWDNYEESNCEEFEKHIWSYDESYFKNFHLLNELDFEFDEDEGSELDKLNTKLGDAITDENYEEARKIQTKIDKLNKK